MQILQRTLFLKVHTANLRYGFANEFYTCLFGFNSQLLHFVFKLLFRRKYMNTLELLKNEASLSFTENGAVTLSTTQSDCLDLFALGGALRDAEETRVQNLFMKAYNGDWQKNIRVKMN